MSKQIPHSTDPNVILVPHQHGRGFAIVSKDGAPKLVTDSSDKPEGRAPKNRFGKLKYVGAALLLSAALGLSAYNLHAVREISDHVTHVEKQIDDVGMCAREGQP